MRLRAGSLFTCIVLLVMLSSGGLLANDSAFDDLLFITRSNPISEVSTTSLHQPTKIQSATGLGVIGTGLIYLYQRLISSQGTDVCVFTPSCSRFSAKAIHQYGMLEGGLMTFDRLQRCQPRGAGYYQFDQQAGKCIDPVEENCLHAH